jgi:hypothetical protein
MPASIEILIRESHRDESAKISGGVKRGNLYAEQYQKDSNPSLKDDTVVRRKYPQRID